MRNLITLEFESLADLFAYKSQAKLTNYTVDRLKRLAITCELSNKELAHAMTFNAIPIFHEVMEEHMMLSDVLVNSIYINSYSSNNKETVTSSTDKTNN